MTDTITVYDDIILPCDVVAAAGMQGRIKRGNERTKAPNGKVAVNIVQDRSLRQYEFGSVPLATAIWQMFEALFEVTDAGAYGFLLEDPQDAAVASGAGLLYPYQSGGVVGTIGLGYGGPQYRLYKRYTSIGGTRTKDRAITRPRAVPAVLRAGSPVSVGGSAGQIAIDYDTGTITFNADTSQILSSITTGVSTVLVFPNSTGIVAAMSIGQRIYLEGIADDAGVILNNRSHAITGKAGSTLTISTSTDGTTGSDGTAYKYPQVSEALTWSGRFYVPVHFASDDFDWSLARPDPDEDDRLFIGQSVVLDEVWE